MSSSCLSLLTAGVYVNPADFNAGHLTAGPDLSVLLLASNVLKTDIASCFIHIENTPVT